MITATFTMKNDVITSYSIEGHADFAQIGQDIVCAAVSSLYITISNELKAVIVDWPSLDAVNQRIILSEINSKTIILTNALYSGLLAISQVYPRNLNIKKD